MELSTGIGGDDLSSSRPFLNYALEYYGIGLSIIPCDGKKPLVCWKKYQNKKPSKATIYRWVEKYPNANIGIVTGKISNISVVDSDNSELTAEMLQSEFGETPFIVETPGGGKHLYYSFNSESCLTNHLNRKIDIRASGGCIIAPHSYNSKKKGFYRLLHGDINDLNGLPAIKDNSLQSSKLQDFSDSLIFEGNRNNALFYQLKEIAKSYKTYESLLEQAFQINAFRFSTSLSENEIISTTKKVWGYKVTNQLYSKKNSRKQEMLSCLENKAAFYLLEFLRANHEGLRKYFYISQPQVAKQIGTTEKTLRKAINFLIEKKLLFRQKIKNEKIVKGLNIKAFMYKYSFY